ncbi:MAG TPA: hypothetical protein VIJ15_02140, partial [Dermatophilaceae bacterium]
MIAISGAMVASLALPAVAAKPTLRAKTTSRVVVPAPSAAQAPLAVRTFGSIGFAGVAKPKPVARKVIDRPIVVAVSRSATRTSTL